MRWASYFNVPISKGSPPGFPIQTLHLQRVITALSITHPETLTSALALFWQNFWVHWAEPTKPENMLAIVQTLLGGDADEAAKVLEASRGAEVKKKLMENTNLAFKEGAFGLPWFMGELLRLIVSFFSLGVWWITCGAELTLW